MKKAIFTSLIGLSLALIFTSCSNSSNTQTTTTTTEEVDAKVPVKVMTVTEQPVDQLVELTATVQANKSNDIATTIPGRIDNITVEVGDRVRKGQLLVQMDKTNLIQAQIQLQNAEKELGRVEELYKSGSATEQQLDQLKTQVDVAKEAFENLKENTTLLSPIDGIVTARNFDPKNIYAGAPAILNVMQISPVKIRVNVSESYFPQMKTGMSTKIKLDVYPDREFEGKVSLIHPTINQLSRTFVAEISIPNADLAVRPGMFARVTLNFGTVNRVVVPDLAVIKQMGTNAQFVFVVKDGIAHQQRVTLGQRLGETYEVLSGVETNSSVVVMGQTKLLEGTQVSIQQ